MKKNDIKNSTIIISIFFLFVAINSKAQDLVGTYTIQRANDGVLNKNVGSVEIKQLVYRDTSTRVRMRKTEYNEIRYYNEWGQPEDLGKYGKIVTLNDGYHIVNTFIPENEYEFIEFSNGIYTKRKLTVNGNGSGNYGNQVEISCPLTNPQNRELSNREELDYRSNENYLFNTRWRASLEPGVIVRKHYRGDNNQELFDITELLVKQGSVQEQNGTVMSQWLIDLTKSPAKILSDMSWSSNLNVSNFINGEIIPQAKTVAVWQAACKAKKPVWCYYKFDPANGVKYGKIYNYYAVIDKRGLVPKGFHIASESDFDLVESILESYEENGVKQYVFTNDFKEQFGGYFDGQIFDLVEGARSAGKWWSSTKREVNSSVFNPSTGSYYKNREILVYEFNQRKNTMAIDNGYGISTALVKYQEFNKNWRICESKYSSQLEGYSVRYVKDK